MKALILLFAIFSISCASRPKYASTPLVVVFKVNETAKVIEPCKGYASQELQGFDGETVELMLDSVYLIHTPENKTIIQPLDYNRGLEISERCEGFENLYLQQGFFKKEAPVTK